MILVVADDLSGAAEIASLAVAANLSAEVRTDLDDLDFADVDLVDFDRASRAAAFPDVVVFDSATRSDLPSVAYAKLKSFSSQLRRRHGRRLARRLARPTGERDDQQPNQSLANPLDERHEPLVAEIPLFKKVDSVLRGVILAELSALSERCALLLPANPSRGRVIRDGRYFVREVPLDETLFAGDPEYPAWTSDVRQLLLGRAAPPNASAASGRPPTDKSACLPVQTVSVDSSLPETGVIVPDLDSHEQLVARLREWAGRGIVAGAADSFAAWLEHAAWLDPLALMRSTASVSPPQATSSEPRAYGAPPPSTPLRRVFICGSHAAWLSGRADQCRSRRIPVAILPDDIALAPNASDESSERLQAPASAWLDDAASQLANHGVLMLALGERDRSGSRSRPGDWAERLAIAASGIAGRVPVGQWYLEGGATASAVVQRFGWKRLTALPMLAPGVTPLRPSPVRLATDSGIEPAPPVTVIVKPGSYAWPESVWQV